MKTFEQVQAMQSKAVRFVEDVLEDDDLADELFDLSVQDYADRKRVTISNPARALLLIQQTRKPKMAGITVTKKQLEETIDEAGGIATTMLDASLTRVELVSLAQDLDALLNGTEYEDDDDDSDDSGEEDDDEEDE